MSRPQLILKDTERATTPANISATPFDLPSNLPMPPAFGGPATPLSAGLATDNANGGTASSNHNNSTSANMPAADMFGDHGDWPGPGNDLWFLPAGPAFFQNVCGPGDTNVGMSAEGINVGGMDLLDYMAMDQYPIDSNGSI